MQRRFFLVISIIVIVNWKMFKKVFDRIKVVKTIRPQQSVSEKNLRLCQTSMVVPFRIS